MDVVNIQNVNLQKIFKKINIYDILINKEMEVYYERIKYKKM